MYVAMAFMKRIIDLKGILFFMLLTVTSEATNLDCYGKAFRCVNSTHFMICVDLGGTSQTLDDFIIPCPPPTVCKITNRFECEFPLPSITTSTVGTAELMTTENEVTTFAPLPVSSVPFEEYLNTVSLTTSPQNEQQFTPTDTIGISSAKPISGGLDTQDFTTTINDITDNPILSDVNTTPMVVIDSIFSSKPSDINVSNTINNANLHSSSDSNDNTSINNDQVIIVQIRATESSNLTTENKTLVLLPSNNVTFTGNEQKGNTENVFTSDFEPTLESITENTVSSDMTTAVVNKTTFNGLYVTEQVVTTTPVFAKGFQEVINNTESNASLHFSSNTNDNISINNDQATIVQIRAAESSILTNANNTLVLIPSNNVTTTENIQKGNTENGYTSDFESTLESITENTFLNYTTTAVANKTTFDVLNVTVQVVTTTPEFAISFQEVINKSSINIDSMSLDTNILKEQEQDIKQISKAKSVGDKREENEYSSFKTSISQTSVNDSPIDDSNFILEKPVNSEQNLTKGLQEVTINSSVADYISLTSTPLPSESTQNFSKVSASQFTKDAIEPVTNNNSDLNKSNVSNATEQFFIGMAESSMLNANQSISNNETLLQGMKNETIENAEQITNSVMEPSVIQPTTDAVFINTEASINDYKTESKDSIREQTVTNEQILTKQTENSPSVTILNNLSLALNASTIKDLITENSTNFVITTKEIKTSVTDSFGDNNLEAVTTVLSTVNTNSAGMVNKPRQEPPTTQERTANDLSPTTEHTIMTNEPTIQEKVTSTKEFISDTVTKLGATNIEILENKTSDLFHKSVSKGNTSSTTQSTAPELQTETQFTPTNYYRSNLSDVTTSISNTTIEEPSRTEILANNLNSSTTDPNITTEIETTTFNSNIEILINTIRPPVDKVTENNITDPLSDADSIAYDINNHMDSKTDKITQNEEVLPTGFANNQASTQDYKSELRSTTKTATLSDLISRTSSAMSDLLLLEETTTVHQVHNSQLQQVNINVESVNEAPIESTIASSVSLSPKFTTMDSSTPRKDISSITLRDVVTQPVTDMSSTLILHSVNKNSQFNTATYIQKQEDQTTDQYEFTAITSGISTLATIENESQTLQSEIIPIETATSSTSTTITIPEAASSSTTDYSSSENANKIYETTTYSKIVNTESKTQPFYGTSSMSPTGTNTSKIYPNTDSLETSIANLTLGSDLGGNIRYDITTDGISTSKVPTEPFHTSDNFQTHEQFGTDTTLTSSKYDSVKQTIIPLTESSLVQGNDILQNALYEIAKKEHNSAHSTANMHNNLNKQLRTNANNVVIGSAHKIIAGVSLTENTSNLILSKNKSANEKPATETNRKENVIFGLPASATQEIITMSVSTNDNSKSSELITQIIPAALAAKTEPTIIVNSDVSQISTIMINNLNEKPMAIHVTDTDLRQQTDPIENITPDPSKFVATIQAPFSHSDLEQNTATIGETYIDSYTTPTSLTPGKKMRPTFVIKDIHELSHMSATELKLPAKINASSIPVTFNTENEFIAEESSVNSTTPTPTTQNHDMDNVGPSNNNEPIDTTATITSKNFTSDLQMNVQNTKIPYRATDLYLGQSQTPENRYSGANTTISGDSTNAANTHTTETVALKTTTTTDLSSGQIQTPGNSASIPIPGASTDAESTQSNYAVNQNTIAEVPLGESKTTGSFSSRDGTTITFVAGADAERTNIVDTVNMNTAAELSSGQIESQKNLFSNSANILVPGASSDATRFQINNAVNQNTTPDLFLVQNQSPGSSSTGDDTTVFHGAADSVSIPVIDASSQKSTKNLNETQTPTFTNSYNVIPQISGTIVKQTKIIIHPPSFETNSPMSIKITDQKDSVADVQLTIAPIKRNLTNPDYSPVLSSNITTKIYEEISTVATFSTRQSPAAKTDIEKIEKNSVIPLEPTTKITRLDGQSVTGIEDNSKPTPSLSSTDFGTPTEMMTTIDVLVNSDITNNNTHSSINSLMTKRPKSIEHIENKGKLDNNKIEVKKQYESKMNVELLSLQGKGTAASSTEIPIVPLKEKRELQKDINVKQPLLTRAKNSYYNTTNYNSEHYSTKFSPHKNVYNGTNTTPYKNETSVRELIENSTSSTYDIHNISKNKSLDQNMSFLHAHNTSVILNDHRSTSRYMLQTKTTAAVYTQTTRFPALESATRKTELNKFSCRRMRRGRYSDELDCKKFYICIGNRSSHVIEGTCPANTVFSEINKQCTKNLSHCIRNNQFRCVTEGHFSDFLNDNVYYICVRNNPSHFIRFKLQCQNGYHLNKTSVRCDLNTETTSSSLSQDSKSVSEQSSSAIKRDIKLKTEKRFTCKKEGLFPDLSNCKIYYKCSKADSSYRQKRKKCDTDEIFHKDKKKCVDADSYEC